MYAAKKRDVVEVKQQSENMSEMQVSDQGTEPNDRDYRGREDHKTRGPGDQRPSFLPSFFLFPALNFLSSPKFLLSSPTFLSA